MTISRAKVVNVRIQTAPTFPTKKGFGTLLLATNGAALPSGDRIRTYSDIDAVAADGHAGATLDAATIFFSQNPRLTQLMIGRRFNAPVRAELLGGRGYSRNLADYQVITDGAFAVGFDGAAPVQVTGVNLTAVTSLAGVAAAIQARLTVAAAGATIAFNGSRFILRSANSGPSAAISFTTAPAAGTDLGALLATNAAGLGVLSPGFAAESVTESLTALSAADDKFYGVVLVDDAGGYPTVQQVLDASAWTEARVKVYGFTTNNSDVLDAEVDTDIGSQLARLARRRTFGIYSTTQPHAAVSAIARGFAVNFNEPNSTITLKFKQLPGVAPDNISESERLALVAKHVNYYTPFGDTAMLAESTMASGVFFDEVHGIDWLQNDIETEVFGLLLTRVTKIPQTDKGVAILIQAVETSCLRGVSNGFLAPGKWNGDQVGPIKTGDFLASGFHVHAEPIAQQSQSDREARRAPPIVVAMKGGGAIHFADVTVTFER